MATATLQDCTGVCYDILSELQPSATNTTSAYPLSLMQRFCRTAQNKILNGKVLNPFDKNPWSVATKGQLPFLNIDLFYQNIEMTSLDAAAAIGDTSISVASTTNFPTTGTLFIGGNIVTYSGITSTTFTGIPATGAGSVAFPFVSGAAVSIAYPLPANYANVINCVYNNSFKVLPQLYDNIFESLMDYKGTWPNSRNSISPSFNQQWYWGKPFYCTKDDEYFLLFNINQNGWMIRMRYQKTPDVFTSPTDQATIPDTDYALSTIPYLAVAEMLYNRGEEQRAADIYNFAIQNVKEMYDFYNNTSFENISWTRYGTGKRHLNI